MTERQASGSAPGKTLPAEALPAGRRIGLLAGPLCLVPVLALPAPADLPPEAWRLAGLTLWMVIWWLSEAVPLAATALLPVAVMPLLGILPIAAVTAHYGNPLIFLFLGGFLLAAAMERHGLHRRIALFIVARAGHSARGLISGFALATAFLSMWISNTAAAMMMVTVATSVVVFVETHAERERARAFGVALMLGIAWSASIGGVGTLIGTPPNALLASILAESHGIEIGFFQWMLFGVPVVAVMLPIMLVLLTRWLFDLGGLDLTAARALITAEARALGPFGRAEAIVAAVFVLTALAWVLRAPLGLPISDSGIAITAALLLFACPLGRGRGFVLDWSVAPALPWGILLLFGGGLALAAGFESSGLAAAVGGLARGLAALPLWLLVLIVAAGIVFLSELTSNTAAAATFLPVTAAVATGLGLAVPWLMLPVAVGASMAFTLPTATPPNAIAFSWKGLRLADMARAGARMDLIAIVVIFAAVMLLAPVVFELAPPQRGGTE